MYMYRTITDRRNRSSAVIVLALWVASLLVLMGIPSLTAHDAGQSDEHGTMILHFEGPDDACEITMVAHHVDVQHATLRIERPAGVPPVIVVDHEEGLEGTPETEGDGYRFEAGPFTYDTFEVTMGLAFVLQWDDGAHSLSRSWIGNECAPDPALRIHQDTESGAVVDLVGCTLFVEGQYIREQTGRVEVGPVLAPPEDEALVTTEDTTPEEDAPGNRFFIGPFTIDGDGHYVVWFFDDEDTPRASHFFDVVGCPEPPVCPPVDFSATAHHDESITIRADGLDHEADLQRAVAGTNDFTHIATLDEGNVQHHDTETEAHTTYTYRLVIDDEVCEELNVTAIPVFPSLIGGLFAAAAGLGAYAFTGRRESS
jgi:hypothetical protein